MLHVAIRAHARLGHAIELLVVAVLDRGRMPDWPKREVRDIGVAPDQPTWIEISSNASPRSESTVAIVSTKPRAANA